jgi:hypothetical protein
METVKVDLQKLQQLNDRISLAIEALNQVRMSTHGLQHSPSPWQVSPWAQPFSPVSPQLLGNPYASAFGLQHSMPLQAAQQSIPYSMFGQQGIPFGGQAFPFGSQVTGLGIGHSSPQVAQIGLVGPAGMADPTWMQRVAQTFPFVSSPYPITY